MATFTNQAQLTYSGRTVMSNTVSGEITEPISVTKTALIEEYTANDVITFVVTLINSGQTAIGDITLTDDLGAYSFGTGSVVPLTYSTGSAKVISNGTLLPAPTVTSESPLTLTGLSVPAGGNVEIVYETLTNEFTPLETGGTVTNTVTASSPALVDAVSADETVIAQNSAELSVVKTLSPENVVTSGTVSYKFTISNTGNAEAPDDTTITDTFDPTLSGITVTFNGTEWTEGVEYDYDVSTGLFTTTAGNLPVPAATFSQDTATGEYIVDPGTATLVVTGTI